MSLRSCLESVVQSTYRVMLVESQFCLLYTSQVCSYGVLYVSRLGYSSGSGPVYSQGRAPLNNWGRSIRLERTRSRSVVSVRPCYCCNQLSNIAIYSSPSTGASDTPRWILYVVALRCVTLSSVSLNVLDTGIGVCSPPPCVSFASFSSVSA